ncbi:MAG: hypothetical protein AB1420_14315 [Bacillota bacterium]
MSNNQLDYNKLLSMLNSDDLLENISRLSQVLGSKGQGEQLRGMINSMIEKRSREAEEVSQKMSHVDPTINLLLALKPFLSEKKQAVMEQYVKGLNVSFFVRELGKFNKGGLI